MKELFFTDEQAALKEIEAQKQLIEALNELRNQYDLLHLKDQFSKAVFIKLIENGVSSLTESYNQTLQGWFEKLDAPKVFCAAINIKPDFSDLQASLLKVKALIARSEVNPYDVNFNGSTAVFDLNFNTVYKHYHQTEHFDTTLLSY